MLQLSGAQLRRRRGSEVSFVPQDPSTALHPGLTIGSQIEEMLEVRRPAEPRPRQPVRELLEAVHLPSDDYPHQLSGGQQHRVVIATALACRPRLVILDKPTIGLHVTTQARILNLIDELRREHRLSMLYVTHDLAVVAQLADRLAVIYGGRIVELAPKDELFRHPRHPYTQRLLAAVPGTLARRRLKGIPGLSVAPGERPSGCFFAPNCGYATELCTTEFPPIEQIAAAHIVRCYHGQDTAAAPTAASPTSCPAYGGCERLRCYPALLL